MAAIAASQPLARKTRTSTSKPHAEVAADPKSQEEFKWSRTSPAFVVAKHGRSNRAARKPLRTRQSKREPTRGGELGRRSLRPLLTTGMGLPGFRQSARPRFLAFTNPTSQPPASACKR